jgi:hypothetical protein
MLRIAVRATIPLGQKVTMIIPANLGGFLHLAEDDVYEQEMSWAGLSPSGRSYTQPAIWARGY